MSGKAALGFLRAAPHSWVVLALVRARCRSVAEPRAARTQVPAEEKLLSVTDFYRKKHKLGQLSKSLKMAEGLLTFVFNRLSLKDLLY